MIEACGRLAQLFGLPRSIGQIYGLLYLSVKPLSLDDLVESLAISKASSSTGTRQIVAWGAVRQVWIPGDRRDYFEAVVDLGDLIHNSYSNFVRPRLTSSERRLTSMADSLEEEFNQGVLTKEEYHLCQARLKNLSKIRTKIRRLVPVVEKFL